MAVGKAILDVAGTTAYNAASLANRGAQSAHNAYASNLNNAAQALAESEAQCIEI